MQDEPENALPRLWRVFSRRGNRTSNSSAMTVTPLRRESGRRFDVTLSMSSQVPDLESQPSEQVEPVEQVEQVEFISGQEQVEPPVIMEELEPPRPPFLESDGSGSQNSDMQDIPPTPESSVNTQSPPPPPSPPRFTARAPQRPQRMSQMSLPQVVDQMFRPGVFPQRPIKKKKAPKRKSILIVFIILLFCGTSCLCTNPSLARFSDLISDVALVFSLSSFPVYAHALFSAALVFEFVYVIKALWDHATYIKKQRRLGISDAPPHGSVIQGANNWEGEPDPVAPTPDLEVVAAAVPPAYGQYRGSVRIHDDDIRYSSLLCLEELMRQLVTYGSNDGTSAVHTFTGLGYLSAPAIFARVKLSPTLIPPARFVLRVVG
jgi:hypothetical protein